MVETGLSCAERDASALDNDVGYKFSCICSMYVGDFVSYTFTAVTFS